MEKRICTVRLEPAIWEYAASSCGPDESTGDRLRQLIRLGMEVEGRDPRQAAGARLLAPEPTSDPQPRGRRKTSRKR